MKAEHLTAGDWFKREGDWRVFRRTPGEPRAVEGQDCIPVQSLQPVPSRQVGFIPSNEEVALNKEQFIRIA